MVVWMHAHTSKSHWGKILQNCFYATSFHQIEDDIGAEEEILTSVFLVEAKYRQGSHFNYRKCPIFYFIRYKE